MTVYCKTIEPLIEKSTQYIKFCSEKKGKIGSVCDELEDKVGPIEFFLKKYVE